MPETRTTRLKRPALTLRLVLLTGLLFSAPAIADSGAPAGARHLLLWNPPVINPDLGIRASARSQTTRIARMAVSRGLKSILFTQSRLMVEVLTKYMKDAFDKDPRHPARVAAYRGGYLPEERRWLEHALRSGELTGVATTTIEV